MAEHVLQGLEVSDEDGVESEGVHVHEPVLLMLLVHPPQCPHRVCASLAAKLVEDFENVVTLNLKDDLEQTYEQSNILIKRMDCQQKTVVVHLYNNVKSSLVSMADEGQTETWRGQQSEPPPSPDEEGEEEHQQRGQVRQHPQI